MTDEERNKLAIEALDHRARVLLTMLTGAMAEKRRATASAIAVNLADVLSAGCQLEGWVGLGGRPGPRGGG